MKTLLEHFKKDPMSTDADPCSSIAAATTILFLPHVALQSVVPSQCHVESADMFLLPLALEHALLLVANRPF